MLMIWPMGMFVTPLRPLKLCFNYTTELVCSIFFFLFSIVMLPIMVPIRVIFYTLTPETP